jgi:hypothetical protein
VNLFDNGFSGEFAIIFCNSASPKTPKFNYSSPDVATNGNLKNDVKY